MIGNCDNFYILGFTFLICIVIAIAYNKYLDHYGKRAMSKSVINDSKEDAEAHIKDCQKCNLYYHDLA